MPVNEDGAGGLILTSEEAACYLRISESWLAKARMREDGPTFFQVGRSIRYFETDLLQWAKARSQSRAERPSK